MNSIKEEVTLRECPFCGPSGRLEIYWEDEPHFHLVGCKTCCTQGPSKVHKDEAITAWNTRSTSDLRAKTEGLEAENKLLRDALQQMSEVAGHTEDCGIYGDVNGVCDCGYLAALSVHRKATQWDQSQ